MGRQKYETAADLAAEKCIADAFAEKYQLEPRKVHGSKADSVVDYFMIKGRQLRAVIEIKDRRGWKPEYGTIILGVTKVKSLRAFSAALNVPSLFVVRLPQGIYFRVIPEDHEWEVGMYSPIPPRDDGDKELCYRIPFGEFTCAISKDG